MASRMTSLVGRNTKSQEMEPPAPGGGKGLRELHLLSEVRRHVGAQAPSTISPQTPGEATVNPTAAAEDFNRAS